MPTVLLAKQALKIGVGNFPPFFIEKENKGLFIDITKEIFAQLPEYEISFVFMSNSRLLHEINLGKRIDVACNIFPDSEVNGYLSEPVFRYTDVAISKKSANFIINKTSDLQNLSIAAYQGSKELLGKSYKEMANLNSAYTEYSHPKETTYLMVSGQKDIRIGDISIFRHDLTSRHYHDTDESQFSIHYLWPNVYSHMAFKDESLRDLVNKAIKKLTENGSIDDVYRKFQSRYQSK